MALVIRDVHHAPAARGVDGVLDVLGDAPDLSQDRVQRVLQRPVEPVPLRRPQLDEVRLDALAGVGFRRALDAAQVLRDVVAREHRLCDVVRSHWSGTIQKKPAVTLNFEPANFEMGSLTAAERPVRVAARSRP
jgi:hypothetical protein